MVILSYLIVILILILRLGLSPHPHPHQVFASSHDLHNLFCPSPSLWTRILSLIPNAPDSLDSTHCDISLSILTLAVILTPSRLRLDSQIYNFV
ncbi:hypothetical protein M422DRAFT_35839 [Sphaerobolus stellatus SS14]|uniref:Uncharacterized protein n=1 Tax=Sphaerobolus stellatus (strain SS14) TaxID=990650 RepID=A0A0C9UT95_SPHS4|nr:hypothetical protein M422DRAFT_35839 [Sphaerobolus stellatus SS14]